MLKKIDNRITHNEIDYIFKDIDLNQDGDIDLNEFLTVFCYYDFSDLEDKAGQVITELREILKEKDI